MVVQGRTFMGRTDSHVAQVRAGVSTWMARDHIMKSMLALLAGTPVQRVVSCPLTVCSSHGSATAQLSHEPSERARV